MHIFTDAFRTLELRSSGGEGRNMVNFDHITRYHMYFIQLQASSTANLWNDKGMTTLSLPSGKLKPRNQGDPTVFQGRCWRPAKLTNLSASEDFSHQLIMQTLIDGLRHMVHCSSALAHC